MYNNQGDMSSGFSSNYEANASVLLEYIEEMFPRTDSRLRIINK